MDTDRFNAILDRRQDLSRKVLATKSAEYSTGQDRLYNFKAAAALQGITPVEALRGMWAKHIVSVMDLIRDMARGKMPSHEVVDEKLGDLMNYGHLFEAVVEEARDTIFNSYPSVFKGIDWAGDSPSQSAQT